MRRKRSVVGAVGAAAVLTLGLAAPAGAQTKTTKPAAPPNALLNLLSTLLHPQAPPPPPAAPATTTTTVIPVKNLETGASGPSVAQLEQRLDALHYFVGAIDTQYDDDTFEAVMAFQKVNNLKRTGTVDSGSLWAAMQQATAPAPLVPDGGPDRVEVDLRRQVLFLYKGGQLNKIIAVSSGTKATPTPTGDYKIYRFDPGWHQSALGWLYNAEYFVGGYAIHGSTSVPEAPASHGCVRIPMTAADWFPDQVSNGMPVYIR